MDSSKLVNSSKIVNHKWLNISVDKFDLETSDLPEWLPKFVLFYRNYDPKNRLLDEQCWISRDKVSLFGPRSTYWILIIGCYPDESDDDRINIKSVPNNLENFLESWLVSCFDDSEDVMNKEVQVFVTTLSHGKNIMKEAL
jgi:hypothetical protein